MICTQCGVVTPPLKTKSCPSCGGDLRLSAEDILGDSELRIVSEIRPPQVELAKTIETAIMQKKNAITEAGTGTGKSLALIIPAILAGKRVLISTATTLLQHQYMTKDLPFLLANIAPLGYQFRFAVAKGRSHYVCRKRLNTYVKKNKISDRILKWASESQFGDKLELGRDVPKFWSHINAEDCAGASRCEHARKCGLTAARALLQNANVVVANHAIVGFNMKFDNRLLPPHNFYIIDEAHQAAEYFRRAFSSVLNEKSIPNAIRYLEESGALPPDDKYDERTKKLRKANTDLFKKFPRKLDGTFQMLQSEELADDMDDISYLLGELLEPFAAELKARDLNKRIKDAESAAYALKVADVKRKAEAKRVKHLRSTPDDIIVTAARKLQRIDDASVAIRHATSSEDTDEPRILYVQFPRTDKRGREIIFSPVFVDKILQNFLFPRTHVAAASATLTVNDTFEHFVEEMGFDSESLQYITASPFDYARRAILYCSKNVPIHPARAKVPQHLMEQKMEEYYDAMTEEIVNLTEASGGHAFILFTSRVEMEEVTKRLEDESDFPVRMQEEGMAAGDLEQWFRNTKNPILCGLKSFWEGVSIEGEQLRLVVITKAPFPQQGDPVYQAKKEIMEKKYNSWFKRFKKLDIPAMITDVKQGTGRLIRTKLDYGVAAILDRKVSDQANKPGAYASMLINSLPFTLITANLGDVKKFLRQFEQAEKTKK